MPHLTLEGLLTADNLAALTTLTALEIVLGIDNIIFIAILVGRMPAEQRDKARILGLAAAMLMRIALLFAITWVMGLDKNVLFHLPIADHDVSGKDLVLLLGGLFLVGKSVLEIHHRVETGGAVEAIPHAKAGSTRLGFAAAIAQIMLLDIVFSLDSVITAVGMAKRIEVMIVAVMLAVGVMLVFSGYIARFVERHPTIKMLALSFLILIGVMLIADGCGQHVPKGYVYFAMAFSLAVEMLNIWVRARAKKAEPAKA
ncbi:MAG TPA: TerC family protein [Phycisphaerales bacterium]|nr:TerC family protein [Phycisphaerales bacterium]